MFLKKQSFKYMFGIIVFVFVFMVGFVKMNIVYSSTGLGNTYKVQRDETISEDYQEFLGIEDKAFIKIYKEDYGFDVVLRLFDEEKIFSLKLPWKNYLK